MILSRISPSPCLVWRSCHLKGMSRVKVMSFEGHVPREGHVIWRACPRPRSFHLKGMSQAKVISFEGHDPGERHLKAMSRVQDNLERTSFFIIQMLIGHEGNSIRLFPPREFLGGGEKRAGGAKFLGEGQMSSRRGIKSSVEGQKSWLRSKRPGRTKDLRGVLRRASVPSRLSRFLAHCILLSSWNVCILARTRTVPRVRWRNGPVRMSFACSSSLPSWQEW